MTNALRSAVFFIAAGLLSEAPATLAAQGEPSQCVQAARALEAGRVAQADLVTLKACPASRPLALATAWLSSAPRTREDLELLAQYSFPDPPVYRAVLDVAGSAAIPQATRLAALRTAMAMVDPQLLATPEWLAAAHVGDPIQRPADQQVRLGPAPPSSTTDIPALLARLSWEEPDAVVRHAALVLRQALELSDPGNAPVRPGTITLTVACHGVVMLRNTENITLLLQIESASGAHEVWLSGLHGRKSKGQQGEFPIYAPVRPVAVKYGGREVARLTERPSTSCRGR